MNTPLSKKLTVPVGLPEAAVMSARSVTAAPGVDGLTLDDRDMDVGIN
jgi:hypothetical protein